MNNINSENLKYEIQCPVTTCMKYATITFHRDYNFVLPIFQNSNKS